MDPESLKDRRYPHNAIHRPRGSLVLRIPVPVPVTITRTPTLAQENLIGRARKWYSYDRTSWDRFIDTLAKSSSSVTRSSLILENVQAGSEQIVTHFTHACKSLVQGRASQASLHFSTFCQLVTRYSPRNLTKVVKLLISLQRSVLYQSRAGKTLFRHTLSFLRRVASSHHPAHPLLALLDCSDTLSLLEPHMQRLMHEAFPEYHATGGADGLHSDKGIHPFRINLPDGRTYLEEWRKRHCPR